MHLFLMSKTSKITSNIHERKHLFLITKCRRRQRWKENHIQYMKDVEDVEDYIQRYMKESIYFSYKNVEDVEDGRKTTYNT